MPQKNSPTVRYADLERLSGELLPERMLLSTAGGRSGTKTAEACRYEHYMGTAGLLGTGLLAEPEHTAKTCVPILYHDGK
ncbi:hypothetical protein [Actinomadura sp. WMMA1423]|uniref:hypothetical protein n=1 Tax=Actinomadura sp. WMMA1423 TaxID=2591108 RepID=UPI0011470AAC|nr:hypothetical protein [Actinomadura sp. WMMA1423]